MATPLTPVVHAASGGMTVADLNAFTHLFQAHWFYILGGIAFLVFLFFSKVGVKAGREASDDYWDRQNKGYDW